jgi:hypothetical protein
MRSRLWLLLVLVLPLGGCVVGSLEPLYEEADVVFQPELLGRWTQDDATWEFAKSPRTGTGSYDVTITDQRDSQAFEGHLVKLGAVMFLDLFPSGTLRDEAFAVPIHVFSRVRQLTPSPTFEPLDHHWVKTFLLANPRATPHAFGDDNRVTLTGSTAEVKAFVRAHAAEDAVFDDPMVLTRAAR